MAPPVFGLPAVWRRDAPNKLPLDREPIFDNRREQNGNGVNNGPNKVANGYQNKVFVGIPRFFDSCGREQAGVCETERLPQVAEVAGVATPSTSPLTLVCLSSCHEGVIDDGHLDRSDPDAKTARSSREASAIDISRAGDCRTGGAPAQPEDQPGGTRHEWETNLTKRVSSTEDKFVPSYETFTTPEIFSECRQKLKYKILESRAHGVIAPPSSVARPNYVDVLRRVAVVVYGHIKTCEWRRQIVSQKEGASEAMQGERFHEKNFSTPTIRYNFIQPPVMAMPGSVFTIKKVHVEPETPSVEEIYDFAKRTFVKTCLSSECSVICLIYIERLMKLANVPLLACNWRPILLGGLLLASKMWQDISSWNADFSSACPEYPVKSMNKLEVEFLGAIGWDLTISSKMYAKYYFALRSLAEKKHPRRRYLQVVQNDKARSIKPPDSAWDLLSRSL